MIEDPCILLIGPRGAGKSSIARIIAESCGRRLFGTDAEIESTAGCSIAEIVERSGWRKFRRIESEVIAGLAEVRGAVIDLGGGAVLDSVNRRLLAAIGKFVLLLAPPEVLARRIKYSESTRPSLTGRLSPTEEMAAILKERLPLYEHLADKTIYTNELDERTAAQRAIEFMNWGRSE